jgi:hypothetical protein
MTKKILLLFLAYYLIGGTFFAIFDFLFKTFSDPNNLGNLGISAILTLISTFTIVTLIARKKLHMSYKFIGFTYVAILITSSLINFLIMKFLILNQN